jgi:hypothetical protein
MSYALAAALQEAVYQRLSTDPALAALVGDNIHDDLPAGRLPPVYVALGPETVRDRSDASGAGALHDLQITVAGARDSFHAVKAAAAAVSDALLGAPLALAQGRVVDLHFRRATARRGGRGRGRRIDLTFRARVAAD